MPFEPLRTDEKIEGPPPKERDMDSQMLFGCSAFVAMSLMSYFLAVWPFFVLPDTHLLLGLAVSCAAGMVPALAFGAFGTRKFGLAGMCGHLGGAMATAVFLFLRLEQMMLGNTVQQLPRPEYPSSWVWMVPTVYVLAALLLGIVLLPKGQIGDEPNAPPSR